MKAVEEVEDTQEIKPSVVHARQVTLSSYTVYLCLD